MILITWFISMNNELKKVCSSTRKCVLRSLVCLLTICLQNILVWDEFHRFSLLLPPYSSLNYCCGNRINQSNKFILFNHRRMLFETIAWLEIIPIAFLYIYLKDEDNVGGIVLQKKMLTILISIEIPLLGNYMQREGRNVENKKEIEK